MLEKRATKKQAHTAVALSVFALVLLVFFAVILRTPDDRVKLTHSGPAPCNLRGHNFATSVQVSLPDIAYWPEAYLTPDELGEAAPAQGVDETQYGTLRAVFLLPDDDIYTLLFNIPGYAGRVYIDGELVKEVGHAGTSREDLELDYKWCVLQVAPQGGQVELVMQVANFVHGAEGLERFRITIGRADVLQPHQLLLDPASYIVMGGLFGAAFLLFGIWLFHIGQTQNLWFALCCFAMAVRAGVVGDTLHRILPILPRMVSLRLEYIAAPFFVACLVLYLGQVFPGALSRTAKRVSLAILGLYVAACLVLPTWIVTQWFPAMYVLAGLVILYSTVRIVRRLWAARPSLEQLISLVGMLVLMAGVMWDVFDFSGFFSYDGSMMATAQLVFAVMQMVSLFIGNTRQVAEAQAAEQELAAQNRALERVDKLKDEFVASAAHELKTPLTVMSGYAQAVSDDYHAEGKDAENQKRLRLISSEAGRMGVAVGQMLDVSRIEENRMVYAMQPCSIMQVIQETVSTYYPQLNKNGNTLKLAPNPDLPPVQADPQRIAQVIINLITNALRHTHGGTVRVSAVQNAEGIRVSVEDTGEGMSETQMAHLFERFSYAGSAGRDNENPAPSGTGLGLYICKHIVEDHGGHIFAESKPGEGTAIRFTLPLPPEET